MTINRISPPPTTISSALQEPPTSTPVVHIYPLGTEFSSTTERTANGISSYWRHGNQQDYTSVKVLHVVRHAQGTHNVRLDYRSAHQLDARLTDTGKRQCEQFAAQIVLPKNDEDRQTTTTHSYLCDTELIVTSPLTRTIQTAVHCMEPVLQSTQQHKQQQQQHQSGSRIPVVALECIREIVNHMCDQRRSITDIAKDHPNVDFQHITTNHDALWQHYEEIHGPQTDYRWSRESLDLPSLAHRARHFFTWLSQRHEQNVVMFSHSDFLRFLWNYGHASDDDTTTVQHEDIDMKQVTNGKNEPIVHYMEDSVAGFMKPAFENCELRSLMIAFV